MHRLAGRRYGSACRSSTGIWACIVYMEYLCLAVSSLSESPVHVSCQKQSAKQALALLDLLLSPKETINQKLQSRLYGHSVNRDGGFIQHGTAKRKLQGVIAGDIGLAKAEVLPGASRGTRRWTMTPMTITRQLWGRGWGGGSILLKIDKFPYDAHCEVFCAFQVYLFISCPSLKMHQMLMWDLYFF